MALLKIARMGHPVLRARAVEIDDPADPELHRLVADMIETMADAPGVGLAAPQVHVPRRVIVFRVPRDRQEADEAAGPETATALINPVVEPLGDDLRLGLEGCLSIPHLRGLVPRHHRIRYAGLALDGTRVEREATGFHARVVQHEVDHLDGVLYLDRMTDLADLVYESELHNLLDRVGGKEDEQ